MPTYIYKREDGSRFEIQQRISDEALKTCPETGQKVSRVITGGAGVVYKGDGWYVKDYKDNNGSSSGSNDTSSNGTSDNSEKTSGGESGATGSEGDSSGKAGSSSSTESTASSSNGSG